MVRFAAKTLLFIFISSSALAQLPPEEAIKKLQSPAGAVVELFAAEPLLTNPAAIDVDTQGRVWVAEIQHYRGQAKMPPADKIKVLQDTDGDGRADRVTVFAEGLFCPMSVCVAGTKVYVATSPDLWVFEDNDGDLHADGPPKKLLTGFGGHNHDHGAHSLVLGPDHQWWMAHGDGGFDVTGADGSHIKYQWGAMLRGELDGTRLETVAVNFRNPYELCVNSFGEVICSDNDNDGNQSARICWIMAGGDYGWFGHPPAKVPPGTPFGEHWHFRGHVPGFVPAMLVTGFGSPCGICCYEGAAFPKLRGAALHCDAGPREVRAYRHTPSGAGMTATSELLITSQGDDYFRPDDICVAPDGTLFIADWYDGGVGGHAYNNPHQGRIYRLKPSVALEPTLAKPGPYTTASAALAALASPNLATQFLAREHLLATPAEAVPVLQSLVATAQPELAARALWLLDRIGGDARQAVVQQLSSEAPRFRELAVRILARHGEQYMPLILERLGDESQGVQREALLAIGQSPTDAGRQALLRYAKGYRDGDRYLTEAMHIAARSHKAELFDVVSRPESTSLERFDLLQALDSDRAATMLAAELERTGDAERAKQFVIRLSWIDSPQAGRAVWSVARNPQFGAEVRATILKLVSRNLAGAWKPLRDDAGFDSDLRAMLADPTLCGAAIELIAEHAIASQGDALIDLLADSSLKAADRQAAAVAVARIRPPEAERKLAALTASPDDMTRRLTLDTLIRMQAWPPLADLFAAVDESMRRQIVGQMAHESAGAIALYKWIDSGKLSGALSEVAIAAAIKHPDTNVRVLYDRFVPEDRKPKRLGSDVSAAAILELAGDARRGREVFLRSAAAQCNKCHAIGGAGGAIGPDLTTIGKKYERAALLETILQPSKAIAPEYVPYLIETGAGQIHLGFVAQRDDREVVLKDAENRITRIPVDQIESIEAQTKSLMPELVLQEVTAQDAADLLAYLTSLKGP